MIAACVREGGEGRGEGRRGGERGVQTTAQLWHTAVLGTEPTNSGVSGIKIKCAIFMPLPGPTVTYKCHMKGTELDQFPMRPPFSHKYR